MKEGEDLIKTLKLRILPTQEQSHCLFKTMEQYRAACNFVSEYVFHNGFPLNSYEIQKGLYRIVREKFGLKAQMTTSVFKTVTARYKTKQDEFLRQPYRYKDEQGQRHQIAKTLEWMWRPIAFKRPQIDLVLNRDYTFLKTTRLLSLNTVDKRIKVEFIDKCWKSYFDGTWTFGTGKVVQSKGKWYFHIPVEKEESSLFLKENTAHVVGIDRGLRFLAVTYDENGKSKFFSGKKILQKHGMFQRRRAELQTKHTWSAYRALKRLSGRENRWMQDVNHCIAKTLVNSYGPNTLFVMEDLNGITFEETVLKGTKEQRRQKRTWSFYQLEQFLRYKAEANHSYLLNVSPKYTSQRCPKCGRIHKSNRKHDTHEYVCDKCGYRSNDDRVGAMNIQFLGTLWVSGDEHPRFGVRKEKAVG